MIKKNGKRILASVLSATLAISLINYKVDVKADIKQADKAINQAVTGIKNASAEAKQADITSKAAGIEPK